MRRLTGLRKWVQLARTLARADVLRLPPRFLLFLLKMFHHEKVTLLGNRTCLNVHYPPLESRALQTLFEGLERIRRGEHRLLSLAISNTWRCPMGCFYCSKSTFADGPELNTSRLVKLVAEAQDMGCFAVHITGGEPMLRGDLPELIASVDHRSITALFTSGIRFPQMSARLKAAGLDYVVVSLDTFDETVNNERRGHENAHGIALDAARAAVAEGFFTVLDVVVDESLLRPGAIDEYVENAARLGVHEVRLVSPRACVALGRERSRCFTPAQVDQLYRFQCRFNRMRHLPTVTSLDHIESGANQGCFGGTALCHLTPNGDVTPCEFYPVSFGNVADRPLAEVYANMRRHIPHPPRVHPLPALFRLIADIPDQDLPVSDPDKVEWIFEQLDTGLQPLPDLWHELGLRNDR